MRFTFENREKIDEMHSHDGEFEGYSFDSENRTIRMTWMDGFEENKRIHLTCNHVIYSEMQSYESWGPGITRIYHIWHIDESPQMEKMKELIDIICESVDWDEEII